MCANRRIPNKTALQVTSDCCGHCLCLCISVSIFVSLQPLVLPDKQTMGWSDPRGQSHLWTLGRESILRMTDDQLRGIDHLALLQIGATGVVGGRIIYYTPCIMLHYALFIVQCIAFYIINCVRVAQLAASWLPCRDTRKWRENEEMERGSLSTFPHFLFISSLSIHFLYQKLSYFVSKY